MYKCCICDKEINKNYNFHYKKCFKSKSKEEFKNELILFNFKEFLDYDFFNNLYNVEGISFLEICKNYQITTYLLDYVLEYHNIKKRNIKDSRKSKRYINKIETTNFEKYGAINPLSKGTEPWKKRNNTVLDKYGVENVWQCIDEFVDSYGSRSKFSKLNNRINEILKSSKIEYLSEFKIKYHLDDKIKWRFFDFKIGNFLLEINGDYWHANPEKYEENEIFKFPKRTLKAKEIWEIDKYKKQIAEDNGFKVIYLWESEINKMNDGEILQYIKNQIN